MTLIDILNSTERITEYTEKHSYETFLKNNLVMDGVMMHLIIIGESINRLSEDFKDKHPDVDWFKIRGLRNRVAHDYKNINYDIAWNVIQNNIPFLKSYPEKIMNK